MYDEVLKCFDHDSITACCSNRGILLYGPLKNHPENVQGSVFWETQPLSWMDWVEGGPFSIGQDIAPIERVHASISWWSECIPPWRVWRFVKQPQLHKLHIEGKWNSWLSPCPMPLQGFLLFGECLAIYSSMVLPKVLVPLTLDSTAQ